MDGLYAALMLAEVGTSQEWKRARTLNGMGSASPTLPHTIPAKRVSRVPGMLNSSEVKVLYPT